MYGYGDYDNNWMNEYHKYMEEQNPDTYVNVPYVETGSPAARQIGTKYPEKEVTVDKPVVTTETKAPLAEPQVQRTSGTAQVSVTRNGQTYRGDEVTPEMLKAPLVGGTKPTAPANTEAQTHLGQGFKGFANNIKTPTQGGK